MKSKKLPAMQFYPGDWRKDPNVQSLNYEERGIWFEMLLVMWESEQRGKLTLNGKKMPEKALAQLLGLDKQKLTTTLTTLLEYGVARAEPDTGIIYNHRMVHDEEIREKRIQAGKLGGNPVLVKQKTTKKKKGVKHLYEDENEDEVLIVEYLNKKTNSNYKTTTGKTKSLIKTRMDEGFTVENFKTVIDKKTLEWQDTDMDKYLRPETLFGTKFESYLNQKTKQFNDVPVITGKKKPWEDG